MQETIESTYSILKGGKKSNINIKPHTEKY